MSVLVIFRLISEICMYFTVLTIAGVELPVLTALTILGLCSLGGALAVACGEKTGLRIACGVSFLGAAAAAGAYWMIAAAPAAYCLFLLIFDRLNANHWTYVNHMKTAPILLLAAMLVTSRDAKGLPAYILYGTAALTFGVAYLRGLRMGGGISLPARLRDLAAVAALPAGAALTAGAVYGSMKGFPILFEAILFPFAWLFQQALQLMMDLMPEMKPEILETTPTTPLETDAPVPTMPPIVEIPQDVGVKDVPPQLIWIVLGIAAALLAVYLIWRFGKYLFESEKGYAASEWTEHDSAIREERDSARRQESNRRKIRKTYAKYLRLMQGKGFIRRRQDTSAEVLESTQGYSEPEACADLRAIYIRARYDFTQKVTTEDVMAARNLLRTIRENLANDPTGGA